MGVTTGPRMDWTWRLRRVVVAAAAIATAQASPETDAALNGLELYLPTPNPFDRSMRMAYAVSGAGEDVSIRVFDLVGRLARTLVDEPQSPGRYITTWDGRGDGGSRQMNAIYFVHIMIGDRPRTVRVAYMPGPSLGQAILCWYARCVGTDCDVSSAS